MTGPVNAYAPNSLYMATAWNPADVASAGNPPFPGTFSNNNRTLLRGNLGGGSNADPACRGTTSRGAPGQKWWLGFLMDSVNGTGGNGATALSFGLRDGGVMNGSDDVQNVGNYLTIFGNGSVYITGQNAAGSLGASLIATDFVGLAWTYGLGLDIYVNSNTVVTLAVPTFTDEVPMFPFFGCGTTIIAGTDPTGAGQQITLQGIPAVQTFAPPAGGFNPWG